MVSLEQDTCKGITKEFQKRIMQLMEKRLDVMWIDQSAV